jgi:hypothetical protein
MACESRYWLFAANRRVIDGYGVNLMHLRMPLHLAKPVPVVRRGVP